MVLSSRIYSTPDEFVKDFLDTLTPGIIKRTDFIKWGKIKEKTHSLAPFVELFYEIRTRISQGCIFIDELADSLLSADKPLPFMKCALELLGHTSLEVVTKQDDIDIDSYAQAIEIGDRPTAISFCEFLKEIGFEEVLNQENIYNVLLGVQIGLETHRRKNIGGHFFKEEVRLILEKIIESLKIHSDYELEIQEEFNVAYGDNLSKKVDFVILNQQKLQFGVEVNFYTVPGSKPTEIKRSYGEVLRGLKTEGMDLIWITDGKGYRKMQKSLRDSYVIVQNIYNLRQVERHLAEDMHVSLTS